jgi:outer membrane lipoprotein-sorting protein
MNRHATRLFPGLLALSLFALPVFLGLADGAGDTAPGSLSALEILEKCDDFHFGYEDSYYKILTVIKDKDGNKSELKNEMWEKDEMRLLIFSEPPDVAGMAILVKDPDTIYIYEPEFNKVRRVAAHAKKQTMLGMDYTLDESGQKHLHKQYDPKLLSEDSSEAVLLLEQKAGLDKAWPKLKVTVDKETHWYARKIEYLDKKGKKRKTEVRKNVKKLGGRWVAALMVMKDHGKKHSTALILKAAKFNKGLPDKMFTKRYLVREE